LRNRIVIIPKDCLIVEGSLKENIDIDNKFSKDYVDEFLNIFSEIISKDEFKIFKELDTNITNNGGNLSEGQKSLIQIFRGLLRKPLLLCFDESNAELDDETEKVLFKILFDKFEIALLVIAHKLNILENFDSIIVIENGKIKDINKPKNILI
jgi:ABC-type multidrug transport system fused ATPase/permease subunit